MFAPLLELVADLGADGVVVVAFEDLHWADPLTWDLFDFLARNLVDEHVVLVGTYRANEVGANPQQRRRLGEVARLPAAHRMHLGGLSRDEVAAKIQTLIGKVPPANLTDEILARGQGNPFFSAELVAAHLSGQAIPAVLSDLIASELEDLDVISRSVVGVIAVVGHDTAHDLLMQVAEVDADRLEVALHAAIDAQLVVVDRDTNAYRFRHALIGEVVYDELLPPERKRLHRRIADVAGRPTTTRALPRRSSRRTGLSSRQGRRSRRRVRGSAASPPTQPRPSHPRPRCAISSARSSCGTPAGSPPQPQIAATVSGRRPNSRAALPATQRAADLAREAFAIRRAATRRGMGTRTARPLPVGRWPHRGLRSGVRGRRSPAAR